MQIHTTNKQKKKNNENELRKPLSELYILS